LRIEDLDRPRVRPGATAQLVADLRWLGLDWDEGPDVGGPCVPYIQSQREQIYEAQLQKLQEAGLVYPCYCSRAEIARVASAPHGDEGPRYPGTCRSLTNAQRQRYLNEGRKPSLRFRVDDQRVVTFTDLLAGPVQQHVQQTSGDFVLRRADGIFAYQFAVVVDDGLMGINQVTRGADLLSSTARQILLFEALGLPIPTFIHVPLWLDSHQQRLSKRVESAGLAPMREQGATPEQVIGQLASSCGLVAQGMALSAHALAGSYLGHTYDIMRTILTNDTRTHS
jgi:glutamyl-tRNA synthetase